MPSPVLPSAYPTDTWPGRALLALDRALVGVLGIAVTVMVGVVSAQVVLRYGFNRSFDWADELSRLAFVWAIFLAIPLGVRQGAHIGIDVVLQALPAAWQPRLRRVGAALSALMMGLVAWAAAGVAREQWDEPMSTLDWSVSWFIAPVGLGAAMSALHLARIAWSGPPPAVAAATE